MGRLKCLVYKNHKSTARHPYVVSNNPKAKLCLPRGPRGAAGRLWMLRMPPRPGTWGDGAAVQHLTHPLSFAG